MWTPHPLLRPVYELQEDIDRIVLQSIEMLRADLGDVDVHHVGSSALPALLSSGTVDLVALAAPEDLPRCQLKLGQLTELHQQALPVRVELADRYKPNDSLRVHHTLATRPMLMGEFLGLQKQYQHVTGKTYPEAKHRFFADVLKEADRGTHLGSPYEQRTLLPHRIEILSKQLRLVTPLCIDAEEYAAYMRANVDSHQRFGSRDPRQLEADVWRRFFAEESVLRTRREALTFLVRKREDNALIGACHFSGFLWRRYQHCYVGYHQAQEAEGHGYMTEAVASAVHYVGEEWGVHRVQAIHDPKNTKSANLLERVGFHNEGRLASYIKLGDQWHDCTLAALHW